MNSDYLKRDACGKKEPHGLEHFSAGEVSLTEAQLVNLGQNYGVGKALRDQILVHHCTFIPSMSITILAICSGYDSRKNQKLPIKKKTAEIRE